MQLATRVAWRSRPPTDLRRAANEGDTAAQAVLGQRYRDGSHGLPKSAELAAVWWARAAAGGGIEAQTSLGTLYYHGEGVTEYKTEAVRLCHLAADQGSPRAQYKSWPYS